MFDKIIHSPTQKELSQKIVESYYDDLSFSSFDKKLIKRSALELFAEKLININENKAESRFYRFMVLQSEYGLMVAKAINEIFGESPTGYKATLELYKAFLRDDRTEEANILRAAFTSPKTTIQNASVVQNNTIIDGKEQPQASGTLSSVDRPSLSSPPITSPSLTVSEPQIVQNPVAEVSRIAQKEAIRRYPELGVSGSKFNRAFLARYKFYQSHKPDYFEDLSWPLRLAEEVNSDPSQK